MLLPANTGHQTNLFGTDLLQQLDEGDPLLQLADVIPWSDKCLRKILRNIWYLYGIRSKIIPYFMSDNALYRT
jgi:hypothetical protein